MKNFLTKTLLLGLLIFGSLAANATTFYVSENGVNTELRDGKSLATAWRTVGYAFRKNPNGTHVVTFAPNDIVQISAGEFVENALIYVPVGVSINGAGAGVTILKPGSAIQQPYLASPVFGLASHSQNDPDDKFLFILRSTNNLNGNQYIRNLSINGFVGPNKKLHGGIYVLQRNNIEIDHVEITGTIFSGVWLWGSQSSSIHHSTFTHCAWSTASYASGAINLAQVKGINLYNLTVVEGMGIPTSSDKHTWGYGIKAIGTSDGFMPIEEVKIYDSSFDGAHTTLFSDGGTGFLGNFSIELHNSVLKKNEIYGNTFKNGISVVSSYKVANGVNDKPIRIYDNHFDISDNPTDESDDQCYAIELHVDYAEVNNNDIKNGIFPIAVWKNNTTVKSKGWKIHHNVFFNNKHHILLAQIGIDDLEFYNNSIYTDQPGFSSVLALNTRTEYSNVNNIKFKNNIVKYGGTTQPKVASFIWETSEAGTATNLSITNNVLENISSTVKIGSSPEFSISSANGFFPALWVGGTSANVPSPYFQLQSGSLARNYGTDVGLSGSDIHPDAGAYEYSAPNVPVSGVSVTPTALSLAINTTSTLTKAIAPTSATDQTVSWNSSDTNIAEVNSSGVVTGKAPGIATITVKTTDGNKTATCTVTVVVPVSSVSVTPTTLTLAINTTGTITKAITPTGATNQTVEWNSSDTNIADVNSSGVVTGKAPGIATITVKTQDGNKTATTLVTVTSSGGSNVVLNSEFDSGTNNWSFGDWTGGVTGSNTLTVQSSNLSGANAAYVNIGTTHDIWKLQLYQPLNGFTLQAGRTYEISFTAKAQAARTMKVILRGSSTNTEYWNNGNVFINLTTSPQSFGPYTFTCGTVNSEATFDISFLLANNLSDVWIDKVSVRDISSNVPVTGVSLTPSSVSLTLGGTVTQQLSAAISPASATNQTINWTSSMGSVASVSSSGLVTALSAGVTTITATTQDGSFTAISSVTVNPQNTVTTVDDAVIGAGTNQHNYVGTNWAHPTGVPAFSNTTLSYSNVTNESFTIAFVGTKIEWYSEKKNTHGIAAVSIDNGTEVLVNLYAASAQQQSLAWTSPTLAQGAHTFKVRVTGTKAAASSNYWVIHDHVKIYSTPVAVAGVSVSPGNVILQIGGTTTQQLAATITPLNATNQSVSWVSNNTTAAQVSSTGLVTAVGGGVATITATTNDGSFTANSVITVNVTAMLDNAVIGSSANQHTYTGTNWAHVGSIAGWYNGTMSYSNVTNESVTLSFVGNKIEWFTEKKNTHGIAAVSIDNGSEVQVDLYAASAQAQLLVWTSPVLTQGSHTFKIRVTGLKNAASSNYWAIHDYVKIYSAAPAGGGGGMSHPTIVEENEKTIIAYPNPVKSGQTLFLDIPETATEIKFINAVGKIQFIRPTSNTSNKIEVPAGVLPQGLTYVQYRNGNREKVIKVIVE